MFLLPVMLLLFSGGLGEVVDNFKSKCPQYFMNEIPPTVLHGDQYKPICQTLDNIQYYATLYDTNNRIPVYSAYKFTGRVKCTRLNKWYIEPQLDNYQGINIDSQNKYNLTNQAYDEDYKNSGYQKGHLAPVCHAASKACADATFTLTNAAPQNSLFNKRWYNMVEKMMKKILTNNCTQDTAHIVTGVVPGRKINNRVSVPSYFWTAYCCTKQQRETNKHKHISGGVTGVNSGEVETFQQFTVKDLEIELKNLYKVNYFFLFDNNCKEADYVPVIPDRLIRQSHKRLLSSRDNAGIGHPLFRKK